eukprot:TRINITY_DN3070_c0_g1_i1.p1 TRINITY_DN3070_c0_g1~~TRINITY_DN3070_c0_g1_i1.p1  ORF type:complete len:158 (-),score=33.36 TRINITY_DN3070_c0_g1_i1:43-516(-)
MAAPLPDELVALNDKLDASKEARGIRGGLGRVKGGAQQAAWGQGFFAAADRPKWAAAGTDPLYRRFTRGPVLGAGAQEEREAATWRAYVEATLREAGGEMAWQQLRDEVVSRRQRDAGSDDADKSLWPHMALAHIPETFLSKKDSMVRLAKIGRAHV